MHSTRKNFRWDKLHCPCTLEIASLFFFFFSLRTSDLLGLEMHLQVQNHHNNHFVFIWTKHNTHTKSSQILKLPAFQPATLHFNHTDRLAITTNLLLFNEAIKAWGLAFFLSIHGDQIFKILFWLQCSFAHPAHKLLSTKQKRDVQVHFLPLTSEKR